MGALWLCILRRIVFRSLLRSHERSLSNYYYFLCAPVLVQVGQSALQGAVQQRNATQGEHAQTPLVYRLLCVACQLCVRSFLLCLRPVFVFAFSCLIFVSMCVYRTEQHKAKGKVSTRGHVLFTGVLCVACLLCVRFVLFFFSLCLCRSGFCAPAFAG